MVEAKDTVYDTRGIRLEEYTVHIYGRSSLYSSLGILCE
jgi:hypothetical protein